MEKDDALLIFTLAYALDWLVGDPESAPHPVRWMGRLIQVGESFLRRLIRTPRAEFAGGLLLSLLVVGAFGVGSWGLLGWLGGWNRTLAFVVAFYFAVTTLATRSLLDEARAVRRLLLNSDLPAARRWGIAPEEVIDFSANINPFGPPPGVVAAIEKSLALANLRSYPDSQAFISALAKKHGVAPDEIVVGPGSAALIFATLRAILPATALAPEPGFDEYFRACPAVEADVLRPRLTERNGFAPDFDALARAIEARHCDLVILISPHNPTGRLYAREDLLASVDVAEANGVAVLLDEAFIDYAPESSLLLVAATKSRLIVLRSLTKFYAIPALRIGYAVCAAGMAAAIREQLDAWPVSIVALDAGRAALDEEEYEAESRRVNAQAREEFAASLQEIGLSVFPSDANFLLVRLSRGSGAELARWLESSRILIRRLNLFCGLGDAYIRLAVRSREDNLRLVSLIETWLGRSE